MENIKVLFLGCFIAGSCAGESTLKEAQNEIVSTRDKDDPEPISALDRFIFGEWEQLNVNCNNRGEACDSLSERVLWSFKGQDVKINNYTHPYRVINDTIYIAGLPHCLASKPGDTVLFKSLRTNQHMWLARRNL
jgi:hypothetical protein